MTQNFSLNHRTRDYLNSDALRDFLRALPGVNSSGSKEQRLTHLINGVNSGNIPFDALVNFLFEQFRFGHNRCFYVLRINPATMTRVRDRQRYLNALATGELPLSNFSKVAFCTPETEEPELVHLHTLYDGENVKKIEMCYTYLKWVNKKVRNSEDNEEVLVDDTDYVWITIHVEEELLEIAIRPRGNSVDSTATTAKIFEDYKNLIGNIFGLKYLSAGDIKTTLYHIYKELTQKAEEPYVNKVDPFINEIVDICKSFANRLELTSHEFPVDLPFRVRRLLERALIQDDFENFESYSEGKIGAIQKFNYSDETGAKVNARAGVKSEGIQLSDIYFDTKETIDDQETFDKLWIRWFVPFSQEDEHRDCVTKIEAFPNHYIVLFYSYYSREEYDYVFSTIKSFE